MTRVLKVVEQVVLVHCSDTGHELVELANTFSSILIDSTSRVSRLFSIKFWVL
jgi:hypothetical protein